VVDATGLTVIIPVVIENRKTIFCKAIKDPAILLLQSVPSLQLHAGKYGFHDPFNSLFLEVDHFWCGVEK
jgi:hypothetical protein